MPFRCKCGRTFEKLDTFGSHTSGCAPFHHRRISTSDIATVEKQQQLQQQQESNNKIMNNNKKRLSIQTDPTLSYFNQRFILLSPLTKPTNTTASFNQQQQQQSEAPRSAPIFEGYGGFMMPTALSIQNTFEGVRTRRSMSFSSASSQQQAKESVTPSAAAAAPIAAFK